MEFLSIEFRMNLVVRTGNPVSAGVYTVTGKAFFSRSTTRQTDPATLNPVSTAGLSAVLRGLWPVGWAIGFLEHTRQKRRKGIFS